MTPADIPFGKPLLDSTEIEAVTRVLSGTQFVHGPVTKQFEKSFAERVGARHAISVSSCTAGLHLSLFAAGIKNGHRVAVPAMTHVATAHAAEYCDAKPIFVDVQPDTGNMDPDALKEASRDGLDAITVVHYLGLPCEMDRIGALAKQAGAFIVEDCALAIDATWNSTKVGTLGRTGCFSFYPVKHMTTIEGGMVTTNDDALAASILQRRAFGYDRNLNERTVPGMYDVTCLGYNYRMNEVEAAVGLAQLGKLERFQPIRSRNYAALKSALSELDEVTVFNATRGAAQSSHYCLNAILPRDGSIDRFKVVASLNAEGIGTSVHYPAAVPLFTYYRNKYGYRAGQFPVAEWLAAQTISLPVAPHVEEGYERRVASAMKTAILKARA